MLQLININLHRKTRKLCSDLSVDIDQGSCLIITGDNSSGKTTLIECLIGRLKPFHGKVLMDGHDLHALSKSEKKLFFESSGIVLHENTLRPYDTVTKALSHHKEEKEELENMLAFLGFEKSAKEMIHNLSFAERRRLDLARSLMHHPRLVIWDEPFVGLDTETVEKFQKALLDLKKSGATIIVSTINSDQFSFLDPEKIIQL